MSINIGHVGKGLDGKFSDHFLDFIIGNLGIVYKLYIGIKVEPENW
jgi:hypothetical protein